MEERRCSVIVQSMTTNVHAIRLYRLQCLMHALWLASNRINHIAYNRSVLIDPATQSSMYRPMAECWGLVCVCLFTAVVQSDCMAWGQIEVRYDRRQIACNRIDDRCKRLIVLAVIGIGQSHWCKCFYMTGCAIRLYKNDDVISGRFSHHNRR